MIGFMLREVFFCRHVNGPQIAHVIWTMCSFYFFLSCQLKACKVGVHRKLLHCLYSHLLALNWGLRITA